VRVPGGTVIVANPAGSMAPTGLPSHYLPTKPATFIDGSLLLTVVASFASWLPGRPPQSSLRWGRLSAGASAGYRIRKGCTS